MKTKEHDKIAVRIMEMLIKLNDSKMLRISELMDEFKCSDRTIRRDLDRLSFLPIAKGNGGYALVIRYLGKITFQDIERFACLAGLQGLFPILDSHFFRELFDSRLLDTQSIHDPSCEDQQHRQNNFRRLQNAIPECRKICFQYSKQEGDISDEMSPYRLVNHAGVWHLPGVHNGKRKAYALGNLSIPEVMEERYNPAPPSAQCSIRKTAFGSRKRNWCSK